MVDQARTTDDRRPHVVMLVDNGVVGDSRVQKQARSMAEKGWRVTVVGKAARKQKRVRFPGFRTVLVPLEVQAGFPSHLDRHPYLRAPSAYRTMRIARARAGRADAAVVAAGEAIDIAKATGADTGVRRLAGRAKMASALARRRWVQHRFEVTETVQDERTMTTSAWDRAAVSLWSRALGSRAWARLDPQIWDWEMSFGPVVDRLKPDLIHANDHRMLAIGARAKYRAQAAGRSVKLVWDAHEWLAGIDRPNNSPRWKAAQVALERHYAPHADAVVTVSEVLAGMLQREFDLPTTPTVVVNAPLMSGVVAPPQNVREVVGLDPSVPLLLYSGGVTPARSVDTIVRALPELPGVHFALVVLTEQQRYVIELLEIAEELGVRDRVHLAPYVPIEQIVPYLAGADVGVHSLLHGPNNEIALATKFYEYAQARLPIVVTDVKVMSETTRRLHLGEVYTAGDAADLARAVRLVLADKDSYRRAYDDEALMHSWTWEAQADELDALYRRVLG